MRNLYRDMDLPNFATRDEIKAQYKRLAREYHPDRYTGNPNTFKRISEAYNVLSDMERKNSYDKELESTTKQNHNSSNTSSDVWGFFTKKAMNVAENYVRNVANEFIEETEEYSPLVQETVDLSLKKTKTGTLSCSIKLSKDSLHKLLYACSQGENLEQYCLELGEMVASEMYDNIMKNWEN